MTPDLSTTYLGYRLSSPVVASASPLTGQTDVLRRMEQAGVGAAVLPSLFEEQVVRTMGVGGAEERASYFAAMEDYNKGTADYLRLVERSRQAVKIPVMASLNGSTPGGWGKYPRMLEEAGASAVEVHIYFVPTSVDDDPESVEQRYVDIVAAIRQQLTIPLAVKISPYFTSLPHFSQRLLAVGADALVLFNRSMEPDLDVARSRVEPCLSLSTSDELRVPLRWLGLLRPQLKCSLAASGGVHTAEDVVKAIAAGADVAMVASLVMQRGVDHLSMLLSELRQWLADHHCASIRQLVGSLSREHCANPSAYERSNYLKAIVSYLEQGPTRKLADDPPLETASALPATRQETALPR